MKTFGLIGYPLSHSFSKKYFSEKFINEEIEGCSYALFPIETVAELPELLRNDPSLTGLNVTIPHKVAVMPYLDELDDAAAKIGAVNCIHIRQDAGKTTLKGYNTDAAGFENSLKPLLQLWHTKALVFGTGGASKAVQYVLKKLNIAFLVCSRTGGDIAYNAIDAALLEEYTVLINTTPLGMSPNITTAPDLPYHFLTVKHLAYDLVYNPEHTLFLTNSAANGATIKNGLEMLRLQAEESWYIWNNMSGTTPQSPLK